MRKASILGAVLIGSTLVACSFQVGGSTKGGTTPQGGTPAPAATPAPAPAPASNQFTGTATSVGRSRATVNPGGTSPGTPPATPGTSPPATTLPILTGTNVFGSGTPDAAGWKGSFFSIGPGATKLPPLATMTPAGVLFAKEINVTRKPMSGGFPGIDPARNENFAIRWEAPLIVDNEADYTFRLVSEDGSTLQIDGTPIVDNDGARDNVAEKAGPVHLVKGTHAITVDYFQSTGQVALQVFCKKAGGAEQICPTRL